jgi:hypothetical protein
MGFRLAERDELHDFEFPADNREETINQAESSGVGSAYPSRKASALEQNQAGRTEANSHSRRDRVCGDIPAGW